MTKKTHTAPKARSRFTRVIIAAWNNPQKAFFYTFATILGGMIAFNATFNQKAQVPSPAHAASQNAAKKSMMRDTSQAIVPVQNPSEKGTSDVSVATAKPQTIDTSSPTKITKESEPNKETVQSEMEALIQTTATTAVIAKAVAQKQQPSVQAIKNDKKPIEVKNVEAKKLEPKKPDIKTVAIETRKKVADNVNMRAPLQLMPPKNVEGNVKATRQDAKQDVKNVKTVQALKASQPQTNNAPLIDPSQKSLVPSARVIAAQKALNRLGYGPIKADGVMGLSTKKALEIFEKDRKMSVTGDLITPTRRVLANQSGIPIN